MCKHIIQIIRDYSSAMRFRLPKTPLLSQESGVAAVEFSLILPILLVLWIGGVEVTSALSVDRKINNLASALGDLTARSQMITYDQLDDIFGIADKAMFPYSKAGQPRMRITAVNIDKNKVATEGWSRSKSSPPAQPALGTMIPETLKVPESQLIMAEVYYDYEPAVGYVITGNIELSDRMFFVPRLVAAVKLCNPDDLTDCDS